MTDALLVLGLAIIIYMATQLVKTLTDVVMGKDDDGVPKRKKVKWLNRLVFPAIPVGLGILIGAFVPLRPGFLIEFVNEYITGFSDTVVYGAYGAIVGQFSDHGYSKTKKAITDFKIPGT
jgi:hypothetical protein